MPLYTGKYKDFFWLQTEDFSQRDVLNKCADFILGKYLAITAFDSGELAISSDEQKAGWKTHFGIVYSPKLNDAIIKTIPYDGFDEWFFLETLKRIKVEEVFVNYSSFDLSTGHATEIFWNQINDITPYAYVADGVRLTVVAKDKRMIESLITLPLTLACQKPGCN